MTPTDRSYCYQISLEGHLEERWLRWFEGVVIEQRPEGITILHGLMDQSALHGILNTIRDLGIALISVQRLEASDKNPSDASKVFRNPTIQEPNQ